MGMHHNIDHEKFPKQSEGLGRKVEVCFNYDTSKMIGDDYEEPFHMIIKLDDGRYILATECQYRPVPA